MDRESQISEVASKGGKARAASLTPEQRSEIAREAVQTRWRRAGKLVEVPQAICEGIIRIGGAEIPCAVLEDNTRVLTQRGVFVALGRHKNPTKGQTSIDDRPAFLAAKNLEPFIDNDLRRSWTPIKLRLSHGGGGFQGNIAFGYRADILPQVCRVFLDADAEGKLYPSQKHIARACRLMLSGLATLGIVALVDEATGFQDLRARDALAKVLESYIAKEFRKWIPTFPTSFFREVCRLKGIDFRPDMKLPLYFGHLVNDLVYDRLAPGVLDELRRKNPVTETGRRKYRHFQWLTSNIGNPHLLHHLGLVEGIAKGYGNGEWEAFHKHLDKEIPKWGPSGLFSELSKRDAKSNKQEEPRTLE